MSYAVLPANFDWAQAATFSPNIVWVIRSDFDLGGITVNMPVNVTLQFEGGVLSNGTLRGNNTKIEASLTQIFQTSITLADTFVYDTFYPEWYGAVGDLSVDDYAAINAACQNANHVTLTQNYSIRNDSQININRTGSFTLLGYNSSITNNDTTIHLIQPIFRFRSLDSLTIKGVTIDGNLRMANALFIDDIDNVTLEDITISELLFYGQAERTVAIRIDIINPSVVYGNNVRINDIRGEQNTEIGDRLGIARAVYIRLDYDTTDPNDPENKEAQKRTKVTFENSNFEWVYGDDGDVIDIADQNYISDAAHRFIFKNCNIRYASRRLVKGSASGIQYYNCKFDTASEAELRLVMGATIDITPSGGVNFRNADPTNQGTFRNMYGKMINCEYRNTGRLFIEDDDTVDPDPTGTGQGGNLVAAYTNGLEIRGCEFHDMYVFFRDATANAIIDTNIFYNSRIEFGVNQSEWEDGRCYVMNNKGFYSPENTIQNALINSANHLIRITICDNKVFSNEDGTENAPFYGLIRHVTAGNASYVDVFRNEVHRENADRNMLFISLRTWDATCRIVNNTNNALGAAASYSFPDADTMTGDFDMNGYASGNIDGAGNPI